MEKKLNPEWNRRSEAVPKDQITVLHDVQHPCPKSSSDCSDCALLWSEHLTCLLGEKPVNAAYHGGGLASLPLRYDRAVTGHDTVASEQ